MPLRDARRNAYFAPRTANPALRSSRMLARRDLILARFHGVDVYIPPVDEPDTILAIPPIVVPINS